MVDLMTPLRQRPPHRGPQGLLDAVADVIENWTRFLQSLSHAVPFEVEGVPVMGDVPEAPKTVGPFNPATLKEHRQGRVGRRTKLLKQLDVPPLPGGTFLALKFEDPLQHVLDSHVHVPHKLRRRCLISQIGRPLLESR
jgi:hypothetical protein